MCVLTALSVSMNGCAYVPAVSMHSPHGHKLSTAHGCMHRGPCRPLWTWADNRICVTQAFVAKWTQRAKKV